MEYKISQELLSNVVAYISHHSSSRLTFNEVANLLRQLHALEQVDTQQKKNKMKE